MRSKAFNFILFQLGWWSSGLLVAQGQAWWALVVTAGCVLCHMGIHRVRLEAVGILSLGLSGYAMDAGFVSFGVLLIEPEFYVGFPHPWLLALWCLFASTLHHSMAWLLKKPAWAAVAGGVFGPAAYWAAGESFAIARFSSERGMMAYGVAWAIYMYAVAKGD